MSEHDSQGEGANTDGVDADGTDPGVSDAGGRDTEPRDFDEETTDPGADSTEQTLVDEEAPKLVVPWDQLSPDALRGVIEEFVTREGTEYGDQDVPLETKVAAVKRQLESSEVLVVFDAATSSANLVTRQQLASYGVEE